ncbi:MAG: prepilin-type N-terminal cleavage/methylation domain-containing protein [Candidatus Eremiobacterota bacterium]
MKKAGITLIELMMACFIFGLFMFAVYSTMELGLKSWQLGETKSDIHSRAEIVINRIISDFSYSNLYSLQIQNNGNPGSLNEYISFETPINPLNGSTEVDADNYGYVKWQGHVIYYIYPLSPTMQRKRTLYRYFKQRTTPASRPMILPDYISYLTSADDINRRTVAKDIYSIDFDLEKSALTVNVTFEKNIRKEASVSFSSMADNSKGIETINLTTSINPKN